MSVIFVAGPLANKYRNGGGVWERLSWVVGLRRLGADVYFVEQLGPEACVDSAGASTHFSDSVNLAWFRQAVESCGLGSRAALVYDGGRESAGVAWSQLLALAEEAELLINLSGHLTLPALVDRFRRKVYLDVDPGFTQYWHADPAISYRVAPHDFYFTIGENIGRADCPIPLSGLPWRPIRQPVVLDDWQPATSASPPRLTTIASWRGPYGPVPHDGRTYGLKVHEFRKVIELPRRVDAVFEIALDIHPADQRDKDALEHAGWQLTDPRKVAGDAEQFRHYIQQSGAEFSVAQGIYVETNSGWFSDRTTRYLASGKPALVQDTGFSRFLPTGKGLVPFRTLDEAVAGAREILARYDEHCAAARRIAEQCFDSDQVLGRLLEDVGVKP